ncbi:MAG TPA: DNA polymerase III subunit delta [Candidatus Saccharimonadales bacterium]|nr:DNA polymerase III subunit delta [Candidatus Saccharimonadales bacterium]
MIVSLSGENSFSLHLELDKLVSAFVTEHTDMALERLDGEEATFEQIQEALQSLPFLASRKMVVLRTPGTNKKFVENAERLLKELPKSSDVIIYEPKFDKRSAYYKLLKKVTDFREFGELDRNGMARWLATEAKTRGGSLSQSDAANLIDRVGANQQSLSNELDKLLLYDAKISRENIELLTEASPQSTIFELLDAAFAGDSKKAMALYDEQRAMKVEPPQIVAMLAWQLHILAIIKTAGTRSPDQIASEAKLNPFVVRKSAGIARKLTLTQLKQLIADLLKIDIRLKRESLDADEALKNYLLGLSNPQ